MSKKKPKTTATGKIESKGKSHQSKYDQQLRIEKANGGPLDEETYRYRVTEHPVRFSDKGWESCGEAYDGLTLMRRAKVTEEERADAQGSKHG